MKTLILKARQSMQTPLMRHEMHVCRYDTGVISGALPYIRDDLLKSYQSNTSRYSI